MTRSIGFPTLLVGVTKRTALRHFEAIRNLADAPLDNLAVFEFDIAARKLINVRDVPCTGNFVVTGEPLSFVEFYDRAGRRSLLCELFEVVQLLAGVSGGAVLIGKISVSVLSL